MYGEGVRGESSEEGQGVRRERMRVCERKKLDDRSKGVRTEV